MKPSVTSQGHPIVYLPVTGSGLICPACADDTMEAITWLMGESHENCTKCKGLIWPEAHPTQYGVLDRSMASLWERYALRSKDPQFRQIAQAARTQQPITWATISGIYQRIEGRLLSGPPSDPVENRWLLSLHYEVRRSHTWLPGPVARTISAKTPVDEEPVTLLVRQPNSPKMRVLLPQPLLDLYPEAA